MGNGSGKTASKSGRTKVDRPKYGETFDNKDSANMGHKISPAQVQGVLAQLAYKPEGLFTEPLALPNPFDKPKFAVTVDGVLSPEECRSLIDLTEGLGYEPALINVGYAQKYLPDVRNNDRCMVDSKEVADVLFQRIKHLVPQEYNGCAVKELNERLRFLRYDPGMDFKAHQDGSYVRTSGPADRSHCTLIIYLNAEFEGGATDFVSTTLATPDSSFEIKAGKALIFKHNILHRGNDLASGRKYILRTDVMYHAPKGPDGKSRKRPPPRPMKAKRKKKPKIDRSKLSGLLAQSLSKRKPKLGVLGKSGAFTMDAAQDQSVDILNCDNATITIPGRCKAIQLSGCDGTQVTFRGTISNCSAYKCKNIKLLSSGCKSYQIEEVEGATIVVGPEADGGIIWTLTNCTNVVLERREGGSERPQTPPLGAPAASVSIADAPTTDTCRIASCMRGMMVASWNAQDGFTMGKLRPGEDAIMGVARINNQRLSTPQDTPMKDTPPKRGRKERSVSFGADVVDNEHKNSAKRFKQQVDDKIAAMELGDEKTAEDTDMTEPEEPEEPEEPAELPGHVSGLWLGQAVPNAQWAKEVPVNPIHWSLSLVKDHSFPSAFGAGYFNDAADVVGSPTLFYTLQGKWDAATGDVTFKKLYDGPAAALCAGVDYSGTLSWESGSYQIKGTWENTGSGISGVFGARLEPN